MASRSGERSVTAPRPNLTLLQKFSILSFLCILGITVAVCVPTAAVFRRHLLEHDAAIVGPLARLLVTRSVPADAFTRSRVPDPGLFERSLAEFARAEHVERLILYDADLRVLWSDDASLIGRRFPKNEELAAALGGELIVHIIRPGKAEHQGTLQAFARLEEIYVPVRYHDDAPVVGVLEIYRDPPAFFAALDRGREFVWILGGVGAVALYLVLFVIVRNATHTQARLEVELAAHARALEARVEERTKDLSRKTQALSVLYAISSTLGQSLDIRDILQRALDDLLGAGGFDAGWMHLLRLDVDGEPIVIGRGVSDQFVHRFAAETRSVATSGGARVIDVEPVAEPGEAGERREDAFRVLMLVPIWIGDRPLGTLNLVGRDIGRFTPDEVQLVSTLARQIGVAIGNARLYAAAREREREARILYETTRYLAEQTDPDSLLTAIVEGAVTITRGAYGGIGFPDGDEIVNHRLVTGSVPGPTVFRHKMSRSLAGFAYRSGRPQVANDPFQDPRVDHDVVRRLGVRNIVCSPLQIRGRVLGVLFICNKDGGAFTGRDLVLLTTFANHAAVALDNAQLRAETLKREREASILYDTSTRLHARHDLDGLLTTIVEGAIEITDAASGGIGRLVGGDIVLHPVVGFSLPDQETELRLPLTDSTAGITYATGEAAIVNDLDLSRCAAPVRETARGYGIRSFLCAPLRNHANTIVGVIKVCNKRGGAPFTDDDLRLLTTFATHAAMAIDNARLFHETKTTKEYLESLIESSVDGIVTLSPRGTVTFVSQGMRRMFDYREEDVLGTAARAYWSRGARDFRAFRRRLAELGRLQNHETELRMAGGVLAANISASLLRNAVGRVTGVLAIVKDVTTLRKLHEQMVQSERLASAGLLAAGVAHEVGNPLTCISALSQVLLARPLSPDVRRGLENIQVHVGRIEKIVQDLTGLTRPAPRDIRDSSLPDLIRSAVELARHNPTTRAMKIDTALEAGLPPIRVARDQILQVFLNIILNAADAAGDLRIRTVAAEDAVHVIFEDTGRGMDAEQLSRLFDPFYSTKNPEQHMGLGLFVSHEIVRQHGGALRAESASGSGTTVTVTLPVERRALLAESAS
jgi:PAS domain S-box-containing protein